MQTQTSWKFDWKATANAAVNQEDILQTVDYLLADGQLDLVISQ